MLKFLMDQQVPGAITLDDEIMQIATDAVKQDRRERRR